MYRRFDSQRMFMLGCRTYASQDKSYRRGYRVENP